MIYLIGGAPRSGKSTLCQSFAASRGIGWMATDIIRQLLPENADRRTWDASPDAIIRAAEHFLPSLEKLVWGVSSLADDYVIEGVEILPGLVRDLEDRFETRSVFLGCSAMTLERFDAFPGKSRGYAALAKDDRARMAADIPIWSELVQREAARHGLPYIDTAVDFEHSLAEAESELNRVR